MSARLLLLCPGQGAQGPDMYALAATDPGAAALIARHRPAAEPDALFANRVAQPAIVCATLAMWEALRERIPAPALVAGYSIGELSAYGVAGALDAAQAIELAGVRAALMDQAAAAGPPQALAAIGGLALARLRALAAGARWHVAIVTGPDTCIVGGFEHDLPVLAQALAAAGARCERLPVTLASHTPLIAAAVAPFAAALAAQPFGAARCPVLGGISAARVHDKAGAVAHLSRQLAETIEWRDCMDSAVEAGITVALELGPGAGLARMFRAQHPGLACRSVSEFRSLDGVAGWVAAQFA